LPDLPANPGRLHAAPPNSPTPDNRIPDNRIVDNRGPDPRTSAVTTAARSAGAPGAPRAAKPAPDSPEGKRRSRRMLLLLAAVCIAPVIASYFTFYVIKPHGGSTNYGALIEPQRPIPGDLSVVDEAGAPLALSSLRGKWLMLAVSPGACDESCAKNLFMMRQIRVLQAAQRERVVTVWLRTDPQPVTAVIKNAYPDTRMFVADPKPLRDWLPPGKSTPIEAHIYLVDPNGNLMMRFPANPDPIKIKADLSKLLTWSGIG
jgi:cytochrome oxidase Cu insertion factor (SCO1/SenC/PrrC family)